MQISEKELEDYIFEDLTFNSGMGMLSRGLTTFHNRLLKSDIICQSKWLRQVDLGPYGRADIIGYYRYKGRIIVELFELKVVPIESGDIDQICRYQKAIEDYFGDKFSLEIYKYLIGTDIRSGHYIHNMLDDLIIAEFHYSLFGISFKSHSGAWSRNESKSFNYRKSLQNAEEVHGY
jgi:hypothetical protein